MKVRAELNYLRIAPRKVRMVAKMIRRKNISQAKNILNFIVKKGTNPLLKLLNSAIANAKNNFQIQEDNLYIHTLLVDEGPKLKRWMPRARGSAYEIQKKTSHLTLILEEVNPGAKKVKPEEKKESEAKIIHDDKPKYTKDNMSGYKPKEKKGGARRFFQRKAV